MTTIYEGMYMWVYGFGSDDAHALATAVDCLKFMGYEAEWPVPIFLTVIRHADMTIEPIKALRYTKDGKTTWGVLKMTLRNRNWRVEVFELPRTSIHATLVRSNGRSAFKGQKRRREKNKCWKKRVA